MSTGRKPPRLLFCAISLAVLAACEPEAPTVEILDLEWRESELNTSRFIVTVEVRNPNGFGGTLAGADYTFELNGVVVGAGRLVTACDVSASSATIVRFFLDLSHAALLNSILAGEMEGFDYLLRGTARLETAVGAFSAPFEKSGRLTLTGLMERLLP